MAKRRRKPRPPVDRQLQRLALAEWSPATANGNRQWCLVLERRPQSSKVLMWYGADTVHNGDLRVVSLEEAARFQSDWNNLPAIVTELLVMLTCARARHRPDWLQSWQEFSVTLAGPERHDGQAPFQYWCHARDAKHAEALVTAHHQATQGTTDTRLVVVQRGWATGGCWNDLRLGRAGNKLSLKTIQTVFQWHAHRARTALLPGRPQFVNTEQLGDLEEVVTADAPEPV